MRTSWKIKKITEELHYLLVDKNKRDLSENNGLRIRIDEKINKIKVSKELNKKDVVDLTSYLIILMAEKEWLSLR